MGAPTVEHPEETDRSSEAGEALQDAFAKYGDPFQEAELETPGDALHMLAGTALGSDNGAQSSDVPVVATFDDCLLVRNSLMTSEEAAELLSFYLSHLHPLYPLLSEDDSYLPILLGNEPLLAAAIFSAAARYQQVFPEGRGREIHDDCTTFASSQIAGLVSGDLPAVRLAQELGLDRFDDPAAAPWVGSRHRRTWSYCYNADRQVAVRLRRSPILQDITKDFWGKLGHHFYGRSAISSQSDGTRESFPEAALAYILGTVQDSLFSNASVTANALHGGKFEQFLRSLNLELDSVRTGLKPYTRTGDVKSVMLHLEVAYIQLYSNAIALRSLQQRLLEKHRVGPLAHKSLSPHVLYMSEGQFILEAIHNAKFLLTEVLDTFAPNKWLRFSPMRLFVWALFAAAFLLKALSFGAIEQHRGKVLDLLRGVAAALKAVSLTADDISDDFAETIIRLCDLCGKHRAAEPTTTAAPVLDSHLAGPTGMAFTEDQVNALFQNMGPSTTDEVWGLLPTLDQFTQGTQGVLADEPDWAWLTDQNPVFSL
ncbi:hypothetical protein MNV49_001271 [Pseudohyphozyma bogoriensis]|nr:hypothetical protein MNV49_001271 [Pseudohyphozyma bogoriensis]